MNTAVSLTILSSLNVSSFLNNLSDCFFGSSVSLIKFLALVFAYFFVKRSAEYDDYFFFSGYMIIFKTFGEFISAAVCVTYGIIEMDLSFLVGGSLGIMMGFVLRFFLRHYQENSSSKSHYCAAVLLTVVYILTVYACSAAFLSIVITSGAIPCFTKVIINVLPMMALSKSLKHINSDNFFIASFVDVIALATFWWYCTETCIKYFFIVPNIVAVILVLSKSFWTQILQDLEDDAAENVLNHDSDKDAHSDDEGSEEGHTASPYLTIEDLEIIEMLKMKKPYRFLLAYT